MLSPIHFLVTMENCGLVHIAVVHAYALCLCTLKHSEHTYLLCISVPKKAALQWYNTEPTGP